jgi:hypothetical protein
MNNLLPPSPESVLSEIFGVQVPPTVPMSVKQRLFTLAARDNADKVIDHPEVAALLEQVGAVVPQLTTSGNLQCFGVLWSKDHPVCKQCGVHQTCRALAASYGLDSIRISPRLLGIRITRMPKIFQKADTSDAKTGVTDNPNCVFVWPSTERDEELLEWLNEYFRPVMWHQEIHYNISRTHYYPISVGKPNEMMEVRFVAPSTELQRLLVLKPADAQGKSRWVLPDSISFDQATSMINSHISTILEKHESSNT